MMTPERRAEIEEKMNAPYADFIAGYRSVEMKVSFMDQAIPEELLAEIDRLTAENARLNNVVDQALGVSDMKIVDEQVWASQPFHRTWGHTVPELAAELETRNR